MAADFVAPLLRLSEDRFDTFYNILLNIHVLFLYCMCGYTIVLLRVIIWNDHNLLLALKAISNTCLCVMFLFNHLQTNEWTQQSKHLLQRNKVTKQLPLFHDVVTVKWRQQKKFPLIVTQKLFSSMNFINKLTNIWSYF